MHPLELKPPGAWALDFLTNDDKEMTIADRFGLVRADRKNGAKMTETVTGTAHHAYRKAVSKLEATGTAGKAALLQVYKTWQRIILFSDPTNSRSTLTLEMFKDVADAQGNLVNKKSTLSLILGKAFLRMGLIYIYI